MATTQSETSADAVGVVAPRAPRREPEKWAFLLPAAIIVLVMSIGPLLFSVLLTFSTWNLSRVGSSIEFSGLYNFVRMSEDPRFFNALKNTITFVLVSVPIQYLMGLALALLLNEEIRGRRYFRLLYFMPFMLSPVVVSWIIGKMLLNEVQGPVNHLLRVLGLAPVNWLSEPQTALISLIAVDAWHSVPFMMILLLAGLQSLPQDPFEAARIDGASSWQAFRYLTFPMLWPVTVTVLLLRSIATFKIADVILVMTGGGPGDVTESLTVYVYRVGVKYVDIGYATAMAEVLLIIVVVWSVLFLRATRGVAPTDD